MPGLIGQLVDGEGAARDWARAQPAISAITGTRVYLEIPASPVYPLLRVLVVSLAGPAGETPVWEQVVQFDAYASTRAAAAELAWAVADTAHRIGGDTPMGSALVALGAVVTRPPVYTPDPDTSLVSDTTRRVQRYSTDVRFVVRSAGD